MADTTVLILCAGEAIRFNGSGLKQLLPIAGEPLLVRTLRQLREMGYTGTVVSHLPELCCLGESFEPATRRWTCETLASTQELWTDKTVVLLGDVVWSSSVLASVLDCKRQPMIFGNGREVYAASFLHEHQEEVDLALRRVITGAEKRVNGGKLWLLYRALAGFGDLNTVQWNYDVFRVIPSRGTPAGRGPEGYVQDFDKLEDYEWFLRRNPWARQ